MGSGVVEDVYSGEKNTHETPRKFAKTKFEINGKKEINVTIVSIKEDL